MHTVARFTAQYDCITGKSYIFDHLRQRQVEPVLSDPDTAVAQAGLWEAFWRARCDRWQHQEEQGGRRLRLWRRRH
jgi:hypothetical protein